MNFRLHAILSFILNAMMKVIRSKRSRTKPQEEAGLLSDETLQRQLEDTTKAAEEWRKKCSDCSKELRDMRKEAEESSKQLEELRKEVVSLKGLNASLKKDNSAMWGKHKEYEAGLRAVTDDANGKIASLNKRVEGHAKTQRRLEEAQKVTQETSRELEHVRSTLDDTKTLLATRTAELRDAQAYLSKTDTVSHADVQRMVEALNAQIFQVAALLTDGLTFSAPLSSAIDATGAYQNTERWIGKTMTHFLHSTLHSDDPVWVQMALGAVATLFASWTVNAWDLKFNDFQNGLLTNIHRQLFEGEPQAISARWRVLSRRYARQLAGGWDTTSSGTEKLFGAFKDILIVSGAQESASSVNWLGIHDKVKSIIVDSIKLQKAIGEDIASTDFQIIRPHANAPFSVDFMEDVEDCRKTRQSKVAEGATVLCTTELGLSRCEKMAQEGGNARIKFATLLKAKVALQLPPQGTS